MSDSYQHIFIEAIPEVDHVAPMGKTIFFDLTSLVFYIPQCDERDLLKGLIEKYGGLTTELHECFTYQLHPLKVCIFHRINLYRLSLLSPTSSKAMSTNPLGSQTQLNKASYWTRTITIYAHTTI